MNINTQEWSWVFCLFWNRRHEGGIDVRGILIFLGVLGSVIFVLFFYLFFFNFFLIFFIFSPIFSQYIYAHSRPLGVGVSGDCRNGRPRLQRLSCHRTSLGSFSALSLDEHGSLSIETRFVTDLAASGSDPLGVFQTENDIALVFPAC